MTAAVAAPARAPWLAHFGFTRTPFTKSLAASELFERAAHQEAAARILHCIQESALGVITGEVGAGKTVAARAARASLDFATRSSTSPTPPSAPAASTSPWSATWAPSPRFFKAEVMAQAQQLLEAELVDDACAKKAVAEMTRE